MALTNNEKTKLIKEIKIILVGIDQDHSDSVDNGWWETSKGKEYGTEKLKQLEKLIIDLEVS